MSSETDSNAQSNIAQAAVALQVTEKTIRNYIDRGILPAEKWNGSWRINNVTIKELFYKKYGNKMDSQSAIDLAPQRFVQTPKTEYDELLRRSGQLDMAATLAVELRSEARSLGERLTQLEASAASGWTEARKYRENLQKVEGDLVAARKDAQETRIEAEWLRRELDQVRQREEEGRQIIEKLRGALDEANEQIQGKQEALDECREALRNLEARYRRDGFLD